MHADELECIGKISGDYNDFNKKTCGFGLFICNILCLMIESRKQTDHKKGLVVYSEFGAGTCFSFSFQCNISMENDSPPLSPQFEKKKKSERKFISIRSCISERKNSFLSEEKIPEQTASNKISLLVQTNDNNNYSFHSLAYSENLNSSLTLHANARFIQKRTLKSKFINKDSFSGSDLCSSSCSAYDKCNCVKVLIVDDVPFNIEVCSKLLEKMKISSDSANNGLDAVRKVTTILKTINNHENERKFGLFEKKKFCDQCQFYKLILMDIEMPLKNGIEATEEILELTNAKGLKVNIIGLSAFDQEDIVKKAKLAGMSDYFIKPIHFDKMNEIVSKYCPLN